MDAHAAKLWKEVFPTARHFKLDLFHLLQRLNVCIPASSRLKGKGPVDVFSLQRLSHRGLVLRMTPALVALADKVMAEYSAAFFKEDPTDLSGKRRIIPEPEVLLPLHAPLPCARPSNC